MEFTREGDGVTYTAWGVITCVQFPLDREDGNVYGVVYRSPTGVLYRRWRQPQEISMTEVDEAEWKHIYDVLMLTESSEAVTSKQEAEVPAGSVLH